MAELSVYVLSVPYYNVSFDVCTSQQIKLISTTLILDSNMRNKGSLVDPCNASFIIVL